MFSSTVIKADNSIPKNLLSSCKSEIFQVDNSWINGLVELESKNRPILKSSNGLPVFNSPIVQVEISWMNGSVESGSKNRPMWRLSILLPSFKSEMVQVDNS